MVGCFAHARREFTDMLKALPEDATTSKTNAEEGLEFCDKLFKLEREYRKEKQVLPKSSLGKAINYCLNQWDKLIAFMLDGRIEM